MFLKRDPLIISCEAYKVCVIVSIALTHNANGSRKRFWFWDEVCGPWFRHEINGAVTARALDVYYRLSHTLAVHMHGTLAVHRHGTMAVHRHGTLAAHRHGTLAVHRHGTRVVQRHGTVGHCYRRWTLVGAQYLQYRGPEVVIHFGRTPLAVHLWTWQCAYSDIRINIHKHTYTHTDQHSNFIIIYNSSVINLFVEIKYLV